MKALQFVLFKVRWGRIALALFVLCALSVLFQLGLPTNQSSSRASLGSVDIVSMSAEDIERTLRAYEDSSYIYLAAGGEQYIRKYKEVGVRIDIDAAKAEATYGLKQKLIPFSALNRFAGAKKEMPLTFNYEIASEAVREVALLEAKNPEPAYLVASSGRVGVVADVPGVEYDVESSAEDLRGFTFQDRSQFDLRPVLIRDELTKEIAEDLAKKANDVVDDPPEFILDEVSVTTTPDGIAEWFTITKNGNSFMLDTKEAEVNSYLERVSEELFIPDVETTVSLLDDREVTRVEGVSGRVLDKAAARQAIAELASQPDLVRVVELGLTEVEPGVTFERSYSKTGRGLEVLLRDVSKARSDAFYIHVQGIDDPDLTAGYKSNSRLTSASLYKMYVAYYALAQIESGSLRWSDSLTSGRQVRHCFEQMILVSSNSCAEEFYRRLGTGNINAFIRELGIPNATVAPAVTTASDSTALLVKLLNAERITPENRDYLIDLMQRQRIRAAIPSGVSPTLVADKPGDYQQYRHDMAIVYGTKGRYAITVLSASGKSYSSIADIAKEIHAFMER